MSNFDAAVARVMAMGVHAYLSARHDITGRVLLAQAKAALSSTGSGERRRQIFAAIYFKNEGLLIRQYGCDKDSRQPPNVV